MATAKPAPQPKDADTTTTTTETATATPTSVATGLPTEPAAVDFTTSPTWGTGGRYVINSAGQRVPASTTEQE